MVERIRSPAESCPISGCTRCTPQPGEVMPRSKRPEKPGLCCPYSTTSTDLFWSIFGRQVQCAMVSTSEPRRLILSSDWGAIETAMICMESQLTQGLMPISSMIFRKVKLISGSSSWPWNPWDDDQRMDGRRLFPAELRSCDHLEPSEWYQAREVFTWFYPSVAIIFIIITINAFPKFMRPQKDRKPQIDDSNRLISSERFGPPGNASHGAPMRFGRPLHRSSSPSTMAPMAQQSKQVFPSEFLEIWWWVATINGGLVRWGISSRRFFGVAA